MATTKAAKKKQGEEVIHFNGVGVCTKITLAKPRTGTVYEVTLEYRLVGEGDDDWDRETLTVVAPNAETAINEAIAAATYTDPPDFGIAERRLAQITEGTFVDSIAE